MGTTLVKSTRKWTKNKHYQDEFTMSVEELNSAAIGKTSALEYSWFKEGNKTIELITLINLTALVICIALGLQNKGELKLNPANGDRFYVFPLEPYIINQQRF